MSYSLKKFEFTKTRDTSGYNGLIGTNSYIGGGQYSRIIGDGGGNTMRNNSTHTYRDDELKDYRVSKLFTTELAHTLPREEVIRIMKRQMVEEIADNIVRDGMYEFFEYIDPDTLGVSITCKLKLVKPPQNNITGRHNP